MNKNIFLYFILAIIIYSLASCDVWYGVKATVVDFETHEPLKGVQVFTIERRNFTTTDSLGYFHVLSKDNQAFKKKKDVYITVWFEKEGYKTLEMKMCTIKKDSIIYLEKTNNPQTFLLEDSLFLWSTAPKYRTLFVRILRKLLASLKLILNNLSDNLKISNFCIDFLKAVDFLQYSPNVMRLLRGMK